MFKNSNFAVSFTSLYLLVYSLFGPTDFAAWLIWLLFALSPLLVVWMVLSVLKDDSRPVQELPDGEHWGYQDRPKEGVA